MLLAVPLIMLVVFAIILANLDLDPAPGPTTSSSSSRTSPSPRPSASSATPEPAPTTQPPATQRPHPPGRYENDNYPVGGVDPRNPLPKPRSIEHGRQLAYSNALYNQFLKEPVRCEVDVLDFSNATDEQRNRQLAFLRDCYMRVWAPMVNASGFYLNAPESYVVYSETQTPCGTAAAGNWSGVYCHANQTIYINNDAHDTLTQPNGALLPHFELTYAHEFGHHVQGRTGILEGSWYQVYNADEAAQMARSRRVELQTQCFSGLSFRATKYGMGFSDYDYQMIRDFYERRRGSSISHGNGAQRSLWWYQGTVNAKVADCNTFMADPKYVDP